MYFNDTRKYMGARHADKVDGIKECDRQLQEQDVSKKLSFEEMESLILEIQTKLREIVEKFKYKGCIKQTAKVFFAFQNLQRTSVWRILKISPVGRHIVAGYDWILTPASIYIGKFLIKFYSKFENILTDSLE